jgi:tetratricopeptide (TPR) repeat protein
LGLLFVGEGGIEEAITFFKVALTANPSVGQFWLSYMDCLMDLGRSVEAQPLIYQAKYKGTNGEIVDQLDRRLSCQGLMVIDANTRRVEASSSAQSNILDTIKLDKALRLAKQKSKDGQLQEAKKICTDILQKFPKNKQAVIVIQTLAEAYHGIANALMQKGDSEAVIEGYEQAISIKPDYAEAYYNLGLAQDDKGDLKAAIASYNHALKTKPEYAEAYNNIGNALKDKGE